MSRLDSNPNAAAAGPDRYRFPGRPLLPRKRYRSGPAAAALGLEEGVSKKPRTCSDFQGNHISQQLDPDVKVPQSATEGKQSLWQSSSCTGYATVTAAFVQSSSSQTPSSQRSSHQWSQDCKPPQISTCDSSHLATSEVAVIGEVMPLRSTSAPPSAKSWVSSVSDGSLESAGTCGSLGDGPTAPSCGTRGTHLQGRKASPLRLNQADPQPLQHPEFSPMSAKMVLNKDGASGRTGLWNSEEASSYGTVMSTMHNVHALSQRAEKLMEAQRKHVDTSQRLEERIRRGEQAYGQMLRDLSELQRGLETRRSHIIDDKKLLEAEHSCAKQNGVEINAILMKITRISAEPPTEHVKSEN